MFWFSFYLFTHSINLYNLSYQLGMGKIYMKCNHCGLCCRDPCTQIAITIGDIWRIADYLKVPVEELFKERFGINPFADPDLVHYSLDLGLNLPCKFRENERCSIYPAKPLNCRLFPYWVLAEAPADRLKEILAEHRCSYDLARREDYKRYKDIVGGILLKESGFFEMNKKIDITKLESFNGVKEDDFRKKELAKINLIKQNCNEKVPIELIKELINENLETIKENKVKLEQAEEIVQ